MKNLSWSLILTGFTLTSALASGAAAGSSSGLRCVLAHADGQIHADVPFSDLISSWRRKEIPEVRRWLGQINQALPEAKRFQNQDLSIALGQIVFGESDDYITLKTLVGEWDKHPAYYDSEKGFGEWEGPVHEWLRAIIARPALTRSGIQDRQNRHSFSNLNHLDPIHAHRYQKLKAEVDALEAKLGQPVYSDQNIRYAAQRQDSVDAMKGDMALLARLGPGAPAILSVEQKLVAIQKGLHEADQFFSKRLVIQIALLNRPEIFDEIQFYAGLAEQGKVWDRGAIIRKRMVEWASGEARPFSETVKSMLLDEIKQVMEVSLGDPGIMNHYVGPMLHYSLKATIEEEGRSRGIETAKGLLESIDWSQAEVRELGQWHLLKRDGLPGLIPSSGSVQLTVHAFGVHVTDRERHRHFALQVQPKWAEGVTAPASISSADYRQLVSLHVDEIRETPLQVRAQDVFPTNPIDLANPLVRLSESNGGRQLQVTPNQLLITTLPLADSDLQGRSSAFEAHGSLGRVVVDAFQGAPRGPHIKFQLFNDGQQMSPMPIFLPLIEAQKNRQVFSGMVLSGFFRKARITVERNILADTYKLTIESSNGLGSLQVRTGFWQGTYRAP